MRKYLELSRPTSCLNKAREHEMLFVLLGRDKAAPTAIRVWCSTRVSMGLNKDTDPQIAEALQLAAAMEEEQKS